MSSTLAGLGDPDFEVYDDRAALAAGASKRIAEALVASIGESRSATLVLAGGSTPEPVYRELARQAVDWSAVELFWGDERCVPPDHPASNFGMARRALLEPAGVPAALAHRILGEESAERAAVAYEDLLRARFSGHGSPPFDLVLLGLGRDGHVASLFPGRDLSSNGRWVLPVQRGAGDFDRVSLSLEALTASKRVWMLVSGAGKAEVVRRVALGGDVALPASAVLRSARSVTWFLDRRAAAGLV